MRVANIILSKQRFKCHAKLLKSMSNEIKSGFYFNLYVRIAL